jgi:putative sterol carrier protein
MAAAAARAPGAPGVDRLVVENVVTEVPGRGEVRYCLVVTEDALRVETGAAMPVSDVEFVSAYDTAVMLARGETNAQRALADGRLTVRGRIGALGAGAGVLAALDDVFAAVRANTSF